MKPQRKKSEHRVEQPGELYLVGVESASAGGFAVKLIASRLTGVIIQVFEKSLAFAPSLQNCTSDCRSNLSLPSESLPRHDEAPSFC